MKSPVEVGKDHGVFLNNGRDHVKKFLHKQSVETLKELGAVNEQGNVDLDTGAVLFDVDVLNALFSLITTDGAVDEEKYAKFVNERSRDQPLRRFPLSSGKRFHTGTVLSGAAGRKLL